MLKTFRLWTTITTTTSHQAAQSKMALLWTARCTKTATIAPCKKTATAVIARSTKTVTIVKCLLSLLLPLLKPLTAQAARLPIKATKSSVMGNSVSLATPRRLILIALLQVVMFTQM